jgi:glycosyltransferase involved in cell wall biosynthesis
MKILQFIYTLEPGGAERFVVDLVNALSTAYDTTLYTIRDDKLETNGFYLPEINQKVKYLNLKVRKGFKLSLFWKFFKIITSEKPDVVHCHLNIMVYFIPLSIIFHKKVIFIYTIHSSAEREVKSFLEKLLRRLSFRYNFIIPVSISKEIEKSYNKFYRLNNSFLIYNGRSVLNKTKLYGDVLEEVEALKKSGQTIVFIHVSRCHVNKNQKLLFNVFKKLKEEGYDLILLVIGQDYEKEYDFNILNQSNIFYLGRKHNVSDYLYASDAFCLSSIIEGMPISLIEAFACGCTPICTPAGGCKDVIINGVNGFLSKSLKEIDYYFAVRNFIEAKQKVSRNELIRFYKNNFSIEECANNYLKLYRKLYPS